MLGAEAAGPVIAAPTNPAPAAITPRRETLFSVSSGIQISSSVGDAGWNLRSARFADLVRLIRVVRPFGAPLMFAVGL